MSFIRGDRVRDNFSNKIGFITGNKQPIGATLLWEVTFGQFEKTFVENEQLTLINDTDDKFVSFSENRFGGVSELRSLLSQIRLNGQLTNIFYSMHNSSTKFMPHQFKPVMKFIQSTTGRLLIADEVGLGKTIEAIYIWKELVTREHAKQLLIVAPSMLCSKWEDDLREKFSLGSEIVNASTLLKKLKERNFHSNSFIYIISLEGIRYKDIGDEKASYSSRGQLSLYFEQMSAINRENLFDLVIIDEAHYLRNEVTASFKTGNRLRDVSQYLLLLSATPIQTGEENLFNLLRLLSPEEYYDYYTFSDLLSDNQKLVSLANSIRKNENFNAIKNKLEDVSGTAFFGDDELWNKIDENLNTISRDNEMRLKYFHQINEKYFYSQYLSRTRKRDAFKERILREPYTIYVDFTDQEKEIYHKVTTHLQNIASEYKNALIFTIIARQRQMTSCMPAAIKYWNDKNILEELSFEDFGLIDVEEKINSGSIDYKNIYTDLGNDLLQKIVINDSKYNKLLVCLKNIFEDDKNEKIIIFSFYRYSIEYLFERLTKDGYKCLKIMGGLGGEKNEIIKRFKENKSINILISSEVGSEGIDLQFSSVEINYDLPWNPMRLEQRIGRIDRIGQEKKKIRIYNMTCRDTIEDRVLDKLYKRIKIFTNTIGDIEQILGDQISKLAIDLFRADLNEGQKEEIANQSIEAMANKKLLTEQLEEQAGLSAAFRDEILNNIEQANENKRYIMSEELINYVDNFLPRYYPGSKVEESNYSYAKLLTLSLQAQSDYSQFISNNRLHISTNMANGGNSILCNFDITKEDEIKKKNHETIDVNHALIKWAWNKVNESPFEILSCSAIIVKRNSNINSGVYVYYIQEWTGEGFKSIKELKYYLYDIKNSNFIVAENVENIIINAMMDGLPYHSIKYEMQDMSKAISSLDKCKKEAFALYENFRNEYMNDNNAICSKQEKYLEVTMERKMKNLEEVIKNLKINNRSEGIVHMNEVKLERLKEQYPVDRQKLLDKQKSRCIIKEITCGIIKVEV
ncbi:hypothetical protein FACS189483_04070 [Spirochaetia bacterium]|nr:hypothetical protein FACS189483_04070 [Spirochaetia bacterium]